MAAVPVSSLSGPGPPPIAQCSVSAAQLQQQQPCRTAEQQQQQHSLCGRAWRGVHTGGRFLPSMSTPVKRQPSEGELLQWAPHITTTITSRITLSPWSDETEERRLVEEEGS